MTYRIVICLDIEADSIENAYSKVYDKLMEITDEDKNFPSWESSDEWFGEDGNLLTEDIVQKAREKKFAFEENHNLDSTSE